MPRPACGDPLPKPKTLWKLIMESCEMGALRCRCPVVDTGFGMGSGVGVGASKREFISSGLDVGCGKEMGGSERGIGSERTAATGIMLTAFEA